MIIRDSYSRPAPKPKKRKRRPVPVRVPSAAPERPPPARTRRERRSGINKSLDIAPRIRRQQQPILSEQEFRNVRPQGDFGRYLRHIARAREIPEEILPHARFRGADPSRFYRAAGKFGVKSVPRLKSELPPSSRDGSAFMAAVGQGDDIVAAVDFQRRMDELMRPRGPVPGDTRLPEEDGGLLSDVMNFLPDKASWLAGETERTFTERLPGLIGKALPDPGDVTGQMRIGNQPVSLLPEGQGGTMQRAIPAAAARGMAVETAGVGGQVAEWPRQLTEAALYMPAGLYMAGAAPIRDIARGEFTFPGTRRLAGQMGGAVLEDITHPLSRGGYLLSDVLGAAGGVYGLTGRLGAGGRAAAAAGGLRAPGRATIAGARAAARGRPPTARDIGGVEVPYGKGLMRPATRAAERAFGEGMPGRGMTRGPGRVGAYRAAYETIKQDIGRARGERLQRRAEGLSDAEQTAIAIAQDRVPVAARLATHRRDLAEAKARLEKHQSSGNQRLMYRALEDVQNLEQRIQEVRLATRYLEEGPDGLPVLRDRRLEEISGMARRESQAGERLAIERGEVTPEQAQERLYGHSARLAGGKQRRPTFGELGTAPKVGQEVRVGKKGGLRFTVEELLERGEAPAKPAETKPSAAAGPGLSRMMVDRARKLESPADVRRVVERAGKSAKFGETRYKRTEARIKELEGLRGKAKLTPRQIAQTVADEIDANLIDATGRLAQLRPALKAIDERLEGEFGGPTGQEAKEVQKFINYGVGRGGKAQSLVVQRARATGEAWDRLTKVKKGDKDYDRFVAAFGSEEALKLAQKGAREIEKLNEKVYAGGGIGKEAEQRAAGEEFLAEPEPQPLGPRVPSARLSRTTRKGPEERVLPIAELLDPEAPLRWELPEGVKFEAGTVYQSGSRASRKAPAGFAGGEIRGRVLGQPRSPIETRRETGAAIRKGLIRPHRRVSDVGRQGLARQRYASKLRQRQAALAEAMDGPELAQAIEAGKISPLAVRRYYRAVQEQPKGISEPTNRLLDLLYEGQERRLTNAELGELDEMFGRPVTEELHLDRPGWQERFFRNPKAREMTRTQLLSALAGEENLSFFDARKLSSTALEQPVKGGKGLALADTINALGFIVALGLKPGYVPANLIGQAALLYFQQGGVRGLHSMMRGVPKLNAELHRLNPDAVFEIRAGMGEGVSFATTPEGSAAFSSKLLGAAPKAQRRLAEKLGVVLDRRWRESAFLYEAKRSGYSSAEQINELLTSRRLESKRDQVFLRAKQAMGEMDRMGPNEQAYVRRLIWFYPWIKASTLYSLRFPLEHPVKSAVGIKLGEQGREQAEEELGPDVVNLLPGVFKVGGGVVDPRAAAIFQSPAQIIDLIGGLTSSDLGRAGKVGQYLTPAAGATMAAIGFDPFRDAPYDPQLSTVGRLGEFARNLSPQYLLEKRLTDKEYRSGEHRLFRYTPEQAIGQFLFGGLGPKGINMPEAVRRSAKQNRIGMSSFQRVFDRYATTRTDVLKSLRQVGQGNQVELGLLRQQTKGFTQLPAGVRMYLRNRAKRDYAIDRLLDRNRDASPLDRTLEELRVSARVGLMSEADAEAGIKLIRQTAKGMNPVELKSYLKRQHGIVMDMMGYGHWEELTGYLRKYGVEPPVHPRGPRAT